MSYLLDKKIKRKKFFKIAIGVFLLVILFYLRSGIESGLSYIMEGIFHPVLVLGNNLGGKFKNAGSYFASKNSLYLQNQNLQAQLAEDEMQVLNYNSLVADDASLKEILGRKDPKVAMILAAILAKPNQSPYDTLIIDAGAAQGIKEGDTVFTEGNMPIGRVDIVYDNSSKVILFSNGGEQTEVVVSDKNIFTDITGRGGGNFEMIMPKDLTLSKGDQAVLPGITPYVVAVVQTIISDPRDTFTKALLTSPINIEELKFVEVEE